MPDMPARPPHCHFDEGDLVTAIKTWIELERRNSDMHLAIMCGTVDAAGRLIEKPDLIHEAALPAGSVFVHRTVHELGYRVLPDTRRDTEYGYAWDIEEI